MNGPKNIYVVIGDGSIPMNSQELAWCKNFPVKFIIIDNKGVDKVRKRIEYLNLDINIW